MRVTATEALAREKLRLLAGRRGVIYRVAQRLDGSYRGVLFHLGEDAGLVCVSRATRLLVFESLSRVVAQRWPLKRGAPVRRAA